MLYEFLINLCAGTCQIKLANACAVLYCFAFYRAGSRRIIGCIFQLKLLQRCYISAWWRGNGHFIKPGLAQHLQPLSDSSLTSIFLPPGRNLVQRYEVLTTILLASLPSVQTEKSLCGRKQTKKKKSNKLIVLKNTRYNKELLFEKKRHKKKV